MTDTIRKAAEVRKLIDTKQQEIAAFIKSKETDGGYDFAGDAIKAMADRNKELNALSEELKSAEAIEKSLQDALDGMAANREVAERRKFAAAKGELPPATDENTAATKATFAGIGDAFTQSDAMKNVEGMRGRPFETSLEIAPDAMKATPTTTGTALPYPAQQPFVIGYPTRRPIIADLIPQTASNQPSLVWLEQTTQNFGAAPVAEAGDKPESDFGWTRRTLPFEVIAHWTKVTEQALEDVPQLRDRLNSEMTIGLQLAEEDQLLNGTGSSPQLEGFLTKAGVQSRPKGADNVFAAFLNALTKIRYTGRANPSGAVFHPNDWENLLTTQDSMGRFIFGDPSAIQQAQRLWGIPFVVTDAMDENTALVGDFSMYSRLWRRGGIRVWFGTESDDIKKNLQTLRVEERVCLTILRPAAFVKLTGI